LNNLETPSQTPLWHSMYADRYHRQALIKEIEKETERKFLVYVARIDAAINHTDILGFGDLLHGFDNEDVDLLLQSPGGEIDRAEKIVGMCRERCKTLRVIVPESAKSAATLIAIASDTILMSDTSELGPVDPQVLFTTAMGSREFRPAQSFLDGIERIKTESADGTLSPAYFPILQGIDPAFIDVCHKAIERSRKFATKWLEKYMCKGNKEKAENIANELLNVKKYLSHGAVIDYKEAKTIGLNVEYCDPSKELWQAMWRLFASYEIVLNQQNAQKVFESSRVSIIL